MNGIQTCTLSLITVALIASAGCAKHNPTRASTGAANPDLQRTASERISDTQRNIQSLRQTVSAMPGRNDAEDRKLIAQALTQTASALSAIEGERPGGSFRQQLRIMQSARGQLERMSSTVPAEPVEDSAIRAAYNAMVSLRDGRFAGNSQISKAVNDVGQQVSQLDSVRGPLHSLVVAQTFNSIADGLSKMSDVLEGRFDQPAAAPHNSPAGAGPTRPAA